MAKNPLLKCLPLIISGLATYGSPLQATEGGGTNYLPGFYGDFGMAVFPGTGIFFSNFAAAYQDIEANTGTLLEMPGLLYVSPHQWLGGHIVTGAFPALMAIKDSTGNNDLDRVALGDFYFLPGGLSWDWGDLKAFLFEGVVAPTGRYETGGFNTGRNYWTFDHNLLLTWNLPANNELSVAIGYMNNLENPSTNYQSGDEFHFDYNLGHYLGQSFAVGISGSYYQQTSMDRAPIGAYVPETGEGTSIGPSVMYMPKINGRDAAISIKWMREFNVTGRTAQEYLICRFQLPF